MDYWEDQSAKSYCNGRKSKVLIVGFYMIRAATPRTAFLRVGFLMNGAATPLRQRLGKEAVASGAFEQSFLPALKYRANVRTNRWVFKPT